MKKPAKRLLIGALIMLSVTAGAGELTNAIHPGMSNQANLPNQYNILFEDRK